MRDFLAHPNALSRWITPARDPSRDRERTASDHNDKVALDEPEMFREDVGTFLRPRPSVGSLAKCRIRSA